MTRKQHRDISGDIGPLYDRREPVKVPMYSYDRPAYIVWQGVFNALLDQGKTEEQAIDILQSKHMRWALDGELSDILAKAGYDYAKKHGKNWIL